MKKCGVRRAAYVTKSGREEKNWKRSLANLHGDRNYLKMGTGILNSICTKGIRVWTDTTRSGQSCGVFCIHCDGNTGPVTNLIQMSHSWAPIFFPPLDPVLSQLNPLRSPLTPYKLQGYKQNWSNNVHVERNYLPQFEFRYRPCGRQTWRDRGGTGGWIAIEYNHLAIYRSRS